MQRTVRGTKFTFIDVDENKRPVVKTASVAVSINELKRAKRELFKALGKTATIIETEEFTKLYILDDEIFFRYAVPVEDGEEAKVENTEAEEV